MNKSIGGPRQESKSFRQQKSDELSNFARDLEKNSIDMRDSERLIGMLKKSAQNLMDVNNKWMIKEETKNSLRECVTETFFCLQDAINTIDDDPWDNEWRCDFSNRIMHKSLPLQSFKKQLINVQRLTYNVLGHLVDNGIEHLDGESSDGFDINDFHFYLEKRYG